MFSLDTLEGLIKAHGLLFLTPLAIIEGPIVTVIAAYFARLDYLTLSSVCAMVIIADVVGDIGFYALGRWVITADRQPPGWLSPLGITASGLQKMVGSFDHCGGRLLVFGKLTHSAGALVLTGAGMARMPLGVFIFYNTLATVPKSLFFLAIGWTFGHVISQVNGWLIVVSLAMFTVLVTAGVMWLRSKP